jgi:hypothetical protein
MFFVSRSIRQLTLWNGSNSEANTFYCATCSNWFLVKSSEDGNVQQYSPTNNGVYGIFKDDMRLPKSNVGGNNPDSSRVMDPRISNSSPSSASSSSRGHSKLVIMEHVRGTSIVVFCYTCVFTSIFFILTDIYDSTLFQTL